MASPAEELALQRKLTSAFIDTQPVMITLIPRTKQQQPGGGFKWVEADPANLLPQRLRLIEPSTKFDVITTEDGRQRYIEFILLGEWDAVINQNDVFRHAGKRWEVVQLYFHNGWEHRAKVAQYG